MEPESSLPYSQQPTTCPYPDTNPVHRTQYHFFSIVLTIYSHQRLGFPSGLFPSGLRIKSLYVFLFSTVRATCPASQLTCPQEEPSTNVHSEGSHFES
jgi:hypothetical protein